MCRDGGLPSQPHRRSDPSSSGKNQCTNPVSVARHLSVIQWRLGLRFVVFPLAPIPDEDLAAINANEKYIEWGWCIPQEIRLFKDDGWEKEYDEEDASRKRRSNK